MFKQQHRLLSHPPPIHHREVIIIFTQFLHCNRKSPANLEITYGSITTQADLGNQDSPSTPSSPCSPPRPHHQRR
jgi:hypothetical protein